jgi:lambda repressor-like predicted transcriptional regulator
MSAEPAGALPESRPAASRGHGRLMRPVVDVLADGTACYAPVGEIVIDGGLVVCHLCGRSLRSVSAHVRVHGWTPHAYRQAFGLERGQPLEGPDTRKRRAAAFTSRLVFEPAVRDGSAAGWARARAGHLARDAAAAAKSRQFSQQRRTKALRALAAIPPEAVAAANQQRARRHLARVAVVVAQSHGYPDIGTLVLDQVAAGASLAAISRRAGLDKDWLSRHLPDIDPAAAAAARQRRPGRWDARWLPALRQLGFPDVASYLHQRHIVQHWTVNAIATEAGLTHHAVASALRRHGLTRTAHATKRHAARERAGQVAAGLGFGTVGSYISDRRAAGWTWQAISAESGQAQSWLRRHQRAATRSAGKACEAKEA